MNLPWSQSNSSDDVWWENCEPFQNKEVVITQKLDGECVDGETILETDRGSMKIQQIVESSDTLRVLCYDENSNTTKLSEVVGKFVKEESAEWYEIEMDDGSTLRVTGNHRLWLPHLKCYRRVDELLEGEYVLLKN